MGFAARSPAVDNSLPGQEDTRRAVVDKPAAEDIRLAAADRPAVVDKPAVAADRLAAGHKLGRPLAGAADMGFAGKQLAVGSPRCAAPWRSVSASCP